MYASKHPFQLHHEVFLLRDQKPVFAFRFLCICILLLIVDSFEIYVDSFHSKKRKGKKGLFKNKWFYFNFLGKSEYMRMQIKCLELHHSLGGTDTKEFRLNPD